MWLNILTVLWFIRAISLVNETPHWLHLKPDEVCWKENEGKGGHTEDVCNVHSKGGRTFHACLRGKLHIYWQKYSKSEKVCNVHSNGGRTFHAGLRGKLYIYWQKYSKSEKVCNVHSNGGRTFSASLRISWHKREYLEI